VRSQSAASTLFRPGSRVTAASPACLSRTLPSSNQSRPCTGRLRLGTGRWSQCNGRVRSAAERRGHSAPREGTCRSTSDGRQPTSAYTESFSVSCERRPANARRDRPSRPPAARSADLLQRISTGNAYVASTDGHTADRSVRAADRQILPGRRHSDFDRGARGRETGMTDVARHERQCAGVIEQSANGRHGVPSSEGRLTIENQEPSPDAVKISDDPKHVANDTDRVSIDVEQTKSKLVPAPVTACISPAASLTRQQLQSFRDVSRSVAGPRSMPGRQSSASRHCTHEACVRILTGRSSECILL
jgi:hypothetical protein